MFETIRNQKKYLMGFLLILIIPSFVFVGMDGYTRFSERGEAVATVDGEDILQADWDEAHRAESERLRQAMPTLDAALLDSPEARYATLERLVRERVLVAASQSMRLTTSDQRLAQHLQQNEAIAALRKADGSLDIEAYRSLLARQGLSPEQFEAQVRFDLSQRQVLQGVVSSGFASPAMANQALNPFFERRELRVASFGAKDFEAQVAITDEDVAAFYQANGALFQAQESVDIAYLVLDNASLERTVQLNEADLKAYYEQNAAQLSGAQERRASHILLEVAAGASAEDKAVVKQKAQGLLDQLSKNPADFAGLARTHSQDPGSAQAGGDLDFFARGAMTKAFEDAAFALNKGQISGLVETEFGFHIIQLTDIKEPPRKTFEEMRPSIEADLKRQQVQRLYAESAERFSNLVYEQSDDLAPAAKELKLEVQRASGLLRQGNRLAAEQEFLASPALLAAIFGPDAVEKKRNTEAVEVGSGRLVSARVLAHTPARTRLLDEVKGDVRARLLAQRSAELARAAGEKRLAEWRAGGTPEGLSPSLTVSRQAPQNLPPKLLGAAMSAATSSLPAWVGVDLAEQGYAVLQVQAVLAREVPTPEVQKQEVQQYAQWWGQAESQAYEDSLKSRFKARILVPAVKTTQP